MMIESAPRLVFVVMIAIAGASRLSGGTIALWLFDEHEGLFPSALLSDASESDLHLALGRGGQIVPGRFGQALRASDPPDWNPVVDKQLSDASRVRFGLLAPELIAGRTVAPLTWFNNRFAALLTSGERHLRSSPFANASKSGLNLGAADWTVEFWLKLDPDAPEAEGVIFELGTGPRGENEGVTRLSWLPGNREFVLYNQASGGIAELSAGKRNVPDKWIHCAFVHNAATKEIELFIDGRKRDQDTIEMQALPIGDEAYFSLLRDGRWSRPLPGAIDELRFSDDRRYGRDNGAPASFSVTHAREHRELDLKKGPPLLFPGGEAGREPIELGSRKHVFLDDVMIDQRESVELVAHPARMDEIVIEADIGWSSVIEDEDGLIRLYTEGEDGVEVWISEDGRSFRRADLGQGEMGNEVIEWPGRRGCVFIDPNGPPEERWKALVGHHSEGGWYLYTSPDGWKFKRHEVAAYPFWAGSASTLYYDDQRQLYVGHHRSDYGRTPSGKTQRFFVLSEVKDLYGAWPLRFPSLSETQRISETEQPLQVDLLYPNWLDNGPLAPPGFGVELPIAMGPDPDFDPLATDLYNTRAIKYPWADDAYVAFPLWFFHYYGDGPETRQILAHPDRQMGTGLVETQLATSRDGVNWTRYPRPAYVPVGDHEGYTVRRPYIAFGMVRRGDQVLQYCYTRSTYHDPWEKEGLPGPVAHRLTQRLDGFVSLRTPYTGGEFTTRPFVFEGSRLELNIDTGATGYAQIGFIDAQGIPISGYGLNDCIYVNANAVDKTVEWLGRGKDVSPLAGQTVRMVVQMRGTDLYAFQFKD